MDNRYHIQRAFTLLELILVIVVLGIVSAIGAEIVAKVYENYLIQRAHNRASIKTELAALQIANRLRYAIPGTIYRIDTANGLEAIDSPLNPASDYKGLQWVGYDGDSFEAVTGNAANAADRRPGWSGFVDLEDPATDINHLKTPASNLALTNTIIGNLSPSGKGIADAYIYFPYDPTAYQVSAVAADVITLTSAASKTLQEHYKLAWSSYALVVEGGDLFLDYDFIATPAANAAARNNATRRLLLKNVSTFKFKGAGRTLRFKLCVDERIGEDYNITSCKEKAVF
jgi:prepilin-type N-terminal cleavage/methylation domain-containing protein